MQPPDPASSELDPFEEACLRRIMLRLRDHVCERSSRAAALAELEQAPARDPQLAPVSGEFVVE